LYHSNSSMVKVFNNLERWAANRQHTLQQAVALAEHPVTQDVVLIRPMLTYTQLMQL
jgi:hypothetical protein